MPIENRNDTCHCNSTNKIVAIKSDAGSDDLAVKTNQTICLISH